MSSTRARHRATPGRAATSGGHGARDSGGLTLVTSFSYVLAEIGTADFSLPAIASFRRLIPAAGVMTEAAANELADALVKASDDGVFFGASNCYAYVARR